MSTSEPRSRSLEDIVEALETTISELNFQLMRLDQHVDAKTESEEEYLPKLRKGYKEAKYWIGILYRYQKGRLDRQEAPFPATPMSGAFMDEEDGV